MERLRGNLEAPALKRKAILRRQLKKREQPRLQPSQQANSLTKKANNHQVLRVKAIRMATLRRNQRVTSQTARKTTLTRMRSTPRKITDHQTSTIILLFWKINFSVPFPASSAPIPCKS